MGRLVLVGEVHVRGEGTGVAATASNNSVEEVNGSTLATQLSWRPGLAWEFPWLLGSQAEADNCSGQAKSGVGFCKLRNYSGAMCQDGVSLTVRCTQKGPGYRPVVPHRCIALTMRRGHPSSLFPHPSVLRTHLQGLTGSSFVNLAPGGALPRTHPAFLWAAGGLSPSPPHRLLLF